jgi:hypothetical protein
LAEKPRSLLDLEAKPRVALALSGRSTGPVDRLLELRFAERLKQRPNKSHKSYSTKLLELVQSGLRFESLSRRACGKQSIPQSRGTGQKKGARQKGTGQCQERNRFKRRDGQKERPERGSGPTRLSAAEGRVRECTLSKISPERRSKSNPEESPV